MPVSLLLSASGLTQTFIWPHINVKKKRKNRQFKLSVKGNQIIRQKLQISLLFTFQIIMRGAQCGTALPLVPSG
jgi:hypothetical protein